jgi:hypothetical protein
MTFKARMSTAIAALAVLAGAAPAMAAPSDRTYDLSKTTTTKSWTSDPYVSVNGFFWWSDGAVDDNCSAIGVDPVDKCDITQVNLDGPGRLDVDIPDAGDGNTSAWSVYVYDEAGQEQLGKDDSLNTSLHVDLPEAEGTYLVVAVPFFSAAGTYAGEVKFTPAPQP